MSLKDIGLNQVNDANNYTLSQYAEKNVFKQKVKKGNKRHVPNENGKNSKKKSLNIQRVTFVAL